VASVAHIELFGNPPVPRGRSSAEAILDPRAPERIRSAFLAEHDAAILEVRRWIRGVVRGGWRFADPEAVVQEILLELIRLGRDGAVRDDRDFAAYVRTVARHSCVDAFRRARIRETASIDDVFFEDEPPGPGDDPERALLERRRREHLRFVWQGLAQPCRDLLRWAYAERSSSAEIANRLGISAVNARVRLHRCLERARAIHREFLT
jgi:RNA polymerase sigma factor (sigma-70 family)